MSDFAPAVPSVMLAVLFVDAGQRDRAGVPDELAVVRERAAALEAVLSSSTPVEVIVLAPLSVSGPAVDLQRLRAGDAGADGQGLDGLAAAERDGVAAGRVDEGVVARRGTKPVSQFAPFSQAPPAAIQCTSPLTVKPGESSDVPSLTPVQRGAAVRGGGGDDLRADGERSLRHGDEGWSRARRPGSRRSRGNRRPATARRRRP